MTNDQDDRGAMIPWVLAAAILLLGASSCTKDESVDVPTSNPTTAASEEPSPVTSQPHSPASEAKELGIFSEVGGWIAYGNDIGIWAVNPTEGTLPDLIRLSEHPGEPVAWSADGSKLLISREVPDETRPRGFGLDLYVLSADGTETRLTRGRDWGTGSISPDGSKVIYDVTTWPSEEASARGEEWRSAIYVVDADGGEPRLLLASGRQDYSDFSDGTTFRTALFRPTFSPDGTKIAYIDGMGDWGNTIRVMNADGSGVRVLADWTTLPPLPGEEFGAVYGSNLAWSSDGSRLTFNGSGATWIVGVDGSGLTNLRVGDEEEFVLPTSSPVSGGAQWSPTGERLTFQSEGGIWVISADGSERRQVAPVGRDPVWSPDGSRIAYRDGGSLYVSNQDGTHVRTLISVEPGRKSSCAQPETPSCSAPVAWNPLPLSASGETDGVLRRGNEVVTPEGPDLVAVDPDTGESRILLDREVSSDPLPTAVGGEVAHGGISVAAWSPDGRWLAFDGPDAALWVLNAEMEIRRLANPGFAGWVWSPTKAQLAMILNSTLTVVDASTGRKIDLGEVVGDVTSLPVWSPDGTRLVFGARGGSLYSVDVQTGERSLLVRLPGENLDSIDEIEWSPDGGQLAVMNDLEPGGGRLYVMNTDGSGVRVLLDDYEPGRLAWSPDGESIAYVTYGDGGDDGADRIWTISPAEGLPSAVAASTYISDPVWSPDSSRIAFVGSTADGLRWFAVGADGAGQPQEIDELTYLSWRGGPGFPPVFPIH